MSIEYWYPESRIIREELPFARYFDQFGATHPEDAELPLTYWTKERILAYALLSRGVSSKTIRLLEKCPLDDLKILALEYTRTGATGRLTDTRTGPDKEWRHTKFYALNMKNILNWGVN